MLQRLFLAVAGSLALVAGAVAQEPAAVPDFPQWAFPGPKNLSIPTTKQAYSMVTMFDRTRAVDWFPDEHPSMPDVVKGHLPVFACGFCHLPEGAGRPENAALAGLPADYFMRQTLEFKSGVRKSPDPNFGPVTNMVGSLHQLPDQDLQKAADYYARLKYTKHSKLIESATTPAHESNGFVYEFVKGPSEPLGDRIIEGPEDFERFEMRDPKLTFVAYVPLGAVARGAALERGNDDRPECASCHGEGLRGGPLGPPIAGRLPTGTFRQLYAFQTGARNGEQAALMKAVVEKLTRKQMIDLAAYVSSLEP